MRRRDISTGRAYCCVQICPVSSVWGVEGEAPAGERSKLSCQLGDDNGLLASATILQGARSPTATSTTSPWARTFTGRSVQLPSRNVRMNSPESGRRGTGVLSVRAATTSSHNHTAIRREIKRCARTGSVLEVDLAEVVQQEARHLVVLAQMQVQLSDVRRRQRPTFR